MKSSEAIARLVIGRLLVLGGFDDFLDDRREDGLNAAAICEVADVIAEETGAAPLSPARIKRIKKLYARDCLAEDKT